MKKIGFFVINCEKNDDFCILWHKKVDFRLKLGRHRISTSERRQKNDNEMENMDGSRIGSRSHNSSNRTCGIC